jgi:hypothetical protein
VKSCYHRLTGQSLQPQIEDIAQYMHVFVSGLDIILTCLVTANDGLASRRARGQSAPPLPPGGSLDSSLTSLS